MVLPPRLPGPVYSVSAATGRRLDVGIVSLRRRTATVATPATPTTSCAACSAIASGYEGTSPCA